MKWKTTVFSILFALIFFDPYFFNIPLGPLRLTLLRVVIISIFIIMLFNIFLLKKEQLDLRNIKFPLVFYGFWFYFGGLSLFWATNKVSTVKELYYFAVFLMLIIVLIYLLRHVQNSIVYRSFWLIGALSVSITFFEFVLNVHLPTSRYVIEAERFANFEFKRATAFFYNENDLALFLVMIFPFYLLGLFKKTFSLKILNFMMVLSIFLINYINNSKLALIALFLQLSIIIMIKKKNWIYIGTRLLFLFLPTVLIITVMIGSNFLQNISLPENINDGTGSTFIRINLYLNSLYTTFQSFMLGVGSGNYQYNINPMFNTQGIINPHNWWLEILTNYGLLVFFGYCCFFLYMLVKLFKIYRENNDKNELALILFLSLSGFSIGCMGPSSLFYFWPMWLLYGVSLGYISKKIQI